MWFEHILAIGDKLLKVPRSKALELVFDEQNHDDVQMKPLQTGIVNFYSFALSHGQQLQREREAQKTNSEFACTAASADLCWQNVLTTESYHAAYTCRD